MKFKYFHRPHQHCDFILSSEYLHITGESYLDLGLKLLCEILRFLKMERKSKVGHDWRPMEVLLEVPADARCPAMPGLEWERLSHAWMITQACLRQHLLSHWIHQNFTFEPACCFSTFTFALHSFKKTLSSPCYFSVGQWVALCQMCPQIIGEGLFTRMLLFCTIVITIKALSQHLGILPLCNVSNHDSETFTQRVFMHPQTVVVSYLLVPLRVDHSKGFFQLTGVLWAPEQM